MAVLRGFTRLFRRRCDLMPTLEFAYHSSLDASTDLPTFRLSLGQEARSPLCSPFPGRGGVKSPTTTRNRQTQFISTFPPSSLSEVDLLPDVVFFNLSGRVMWFDQASTTTILQSLARRLLRRLCASTALCLKIVIVLCVGRPASATFVSRVLYRLPSCRSASSQTS